MRLIPLTKGYSAMVDDADFEWLNQWKWRAHPAKNTVYAATHVKMPDGRRTTQLMHRLIMGLTDPKIKIDHQFHNGLDNQRKNLRIATNAQNARNQQVRINSVSGYKGVSFDANSGKFRAAYGFDGTYTRMGSFTCKHEAARHYNRAARDHGEGFDLLNNVEPMFPTEQRVTRAIGDASRVAATKERTAKYLSDLSIGLYVVKHRGITFSKVYGKWVAKLKRKHLGCFLTQDEAIEAQNTAKQNLVTGN